MQPVRPLLARTGRETVQILGSFAIGTAAFCIVVTLLTTSSSLAITFVGLPLATLTVVAARWAGRRDRHPALRAHRGQGALRGVRAAHHRALHRLP